MMKRDASLKVRLTHMPSLGPSGISLWQEGGDCLPARCVLDKCKNRNTGGWRNMYFWQTWDVKPPN